MNADRRSASLAESTLRNRQRKIGLLLACLAASTFSLSAADQVQSNAAPEKVLLLDSLGRVVEVSTNELSPDLQPSAREGLKNQIPDPVSGSSVAPEVQQRMEASRAGQVGVQFFPGVPPLLMPYLASKDEFGNTAVRPGALIPSVPLEPWVQAGKYGLSEFGFRYSLQQTLTCIGLTDVKQGDDSLSFYTFQLKSKWALFAAPDADTAGWISSEVDAKSGLGGAGATQDAKSNLGTLTDPTSIWNKINGFRMPELAWQESLRQGQIVLVAGMISQKNYLDANTYADSARSKFMNSGLINSQVLPLAQNNFGFNLQWQPWDEWYAMLGSSAGNAPVGTAPWTDFTWNDWSVPLEIGYAPRDVFGLGSGVYRLQPFVAGANGNTGGGVCLDLQQKLGPESPFGWFGRFGCGNAKVSATADEQVGTGFVMQGPFKHFVLGRTSNDLLGTGFVWSQPADSTKTVYHENEYVWETVYALQLTPFIKIQPDLQMIWNPTYHRDASRAMVFQLQIAVAW
jgi:carbohydrate-selective porin OprB